MMRIYEPKPWDIRRCDMVLADDGEYVRYDDAHAKIERLTKAHDTVCGALAEAISRAEKAEAERDRVLAQVAMAFEEAADKAECCLLCQDDIRALTPADAKAALEAYGRDKMRDGMQRAAEVARECWNDPLCEADAEYIPNAILAAMEKEGGK